MKMFKFANYIKDSWIEISEKVEWLSYEEVQKASTKVVIFSLVSSIFVLCLDFIVKFLISKIV